MTNVTDRFDHSIAGRIRAKSQALAKRWLERLDEIFLSGATDDGRTICIRDNGVGVPAPDVPYIFENFFRASPEKDGELGIKGSGLGLAIVAECVEAIGGRISVASVEGEGTAFDLWIPAEAKRPEPTHPG